jgi:hypothetical protein
MSWTGTMSCTFRKFKDISKPLKEMFRSDAHATDRHCRGSESDGFPESCFPSTCHVRAGAGRIRIRPLSLSSGAMVRGNRRSGPKRVPRRMTRRLYYMGFRAPARGPLVLWLAAGSESARQSNKIRVQRLINNNITQNRASSRPR